MSYDIFIKSKESVLQFNKRIGDSTWYKASDRQIVYDNKDTGVYFIIDFLLKVDDEICVSVHINYCRPNCFIDEFICEIKKWNLEGVDIYDP